MVWVILMLFLLKKESSFELLALSYWPMSKVPLVFEAMGGAMTGYCRPIFSPVPLRNIRLVERISGQVSAFDANFDNYFTCSNLVLLGHCWHENQINSFSIVAKKPISHTF
jgi:hypothetical protein